MRSKHLSEFCNSPVSINTLFEGRLLPTKGFLELLLLSEQQAAPPHHQLRHTGGVEAHTCCQRTARYSMSGAVGTGSSGSEWCKDHQTVVRRGRRHSPGISSRWQRVAEPVWSRCSSLASPGHAPLLRARVRFRTRTSNGLSSEHKYRVRFRVRLG